MQRTGQLCFYLKSIIYRLMAPIENQDWQDCASQCSTMAHRASVDASDSNAEKKIFKREVLKDNEQKSRQKQRLTPLVKAREN
jgi:hypothetical protein